MLFVNAITFAYGQSYSITPNDSIVSNTSFNTTTHFDIQQNNLTAGSLVFSWQLVALNFPAGWTASLCDNANCYGGFPAGGTMDTVFTGNNGFISIGINPDTITGTALIQYVVWEASTPTQVDKIGRASCRERV